MAEEQQKTQEQTAKPTAEETSQASASNQQAENSEGGEFPDAKQGDKVKPILDKEQPAKKEQKQQKQEKWGIIHIYSSYNNTHLHVTDITGTETLAKATGGMITKSDRLKATPNVAMAAAKQISETCHQQGITALYVKLRAVGGHNGPMTPGPGAQASIRMLTRYGIKLGRIEDVTPVPHDTCRKKGGRRGRRV